jgi:hypothetical protein
MDLLETYLLAETLDREHAASVQKHEPSPKTPTSTPMTPEEFAAKMREAYETHWMKEEDEEVVHIVMDGIMCNLLRSLGYGEGVDIFDETPMWYS